MGHIGYVDSQLHAAVAVSGKRDCVVKVSGVGGIDRYDGQLAKVFAILHLFSRTVGDRRRPGLRQHRLRKLTRQLVLLDDAQSVDARLAAPTQNLGDDPAGLCALGRILGDLYHHRIARLGALRTRVPDQNGHVQGVTVGNNEPPL